MTTAARSNQILDENNIPVQGALVYVYDVFGNLAALTSDGTTSILNPLKTDQFGNYAYQALVAYYNEDIWYGGRRQWRENNVALGSPGADLALRTDLAAATGAALIGFGVPPGTATADVSISAGQLVNLYVTGGVTHMQLADGSVQSKPAHAFCPVSVLNGATGMWVRRGLIPGTAATTFAADLWLSDAVPGAYQNAAPMTVGHTSQRIGMVLPGVGVEFSPQLEMYL